MRPLEGIRVVEVGMWAFVPSAGSVLAEWGADVVKVESLGGDPIRGLTFGGIEPGYGGVSFMWETFNRGKHSVAVDLDTPTGKEIVLRLIDDADVLLVSLLPPARRRMGIDTADVIERNSRIIVASGSGQGPDGDEAENPGFDAMSFWARGGVASAVTPTGDWPVGMPTGAFGDVIAGLVLAGAVAAAVARRERTGEGGTVDVSLLGTAMWGMQVGISGAALRGVDELPKMDRHALRNPLVATYKTADDRYLSLSMLQSDRYWAGLCQALGRADLVEDPRFASHELRDTNRLECVAVLDEVFAQRPLREWKSALATQEGPWDIVQTMGELVNDPQARANRYVQRVDHGDGAGLEMVSSPARFDGTPPAVGPAPELGADTEEVLVALGMDEEQILQAKIEGAVL